LGYIDEPDDFEGDLKMVEAEKVLGALLRSMRSI
jgi:hypothetical protein